MAAIGVFVASAAVSDEEPLVRLLATFLRSLIVAASREQKEAIGTLEWFVA